MTPSENNGNNATTVPGHSLGKGLTSRQLVMMALGSSIGTGLFVGTGHAIGVAGPAVLLSFAVAALIICVIMFMLGEMATAFPHSGAFSYYAQRAMGPVAGATVGWLWWVEVVVVVAAEATAAASFASQVWAGIPQGLWALIFMAVFTVVNLLGVARFGETEFWFAFVKVTIIVAFLGIGVLLITGVIPGMEQPGLGNLVQEGGFFPTGMPGMIASLLIVMFSFGGMELLTVAAGETQDAQKAIARAVKSTIWRISVLYIGSAFIMVTVLPWNSAAMANPFASVLALAGIPYAQTVTTLVLTVALLSALNVNIYGASRMLYSLSERRMAPRFLMRTGAGKVPVGAVIASVLVGFFTVALNYLYPEQILPFLLQVVGATVILMWVATILSHLIIRRRLEAAGQRPALATPGYPYLSWLTLGLLSAIIIAGLFDTQVRSQLIGVTALTACIALGCWLRYRSKAPPSQSERTVSAPSQTPSS